MNPLLFEGFLAGGIAAGAARVRRRYLGHGARLTQRGLGRDRGGRVPCQAASSPRRRTLRTSRPSRRASAARTSWAACGSSRSVLAPTSSRASKAPLRGVRHQRRADVQRPWPCLDACPQRDRLEGGPVVAAVQDLGRGQGGPAAGPDPVAHYRDGRHSQADAHPRRGQVLAERHLGVRRLRRCGRPLRAAMALRQRRPC